MEKKIDFNSFDFNKDLKKTIKEKSGSTKNVDITGFPLDKAKSLLKNNLIQSAIGLLIFLVVFGLTSIFFFLFYSPVYLFSFIGIFIILYKVFKNRLSSKFKI